MKTIHMMYLSLHAKPEVLYARCVTDGTLEVHWSHLSGNQTVGVPWEGLVTGDHLRVEIVEGGVNVLCQ